MCSFAFPSYAASDGTEDIIASDIDLTVQEFDENSQWHDIKNNAFSGIWNRDTFSRFKGFHYVSVMHSSIEGIKVQVVMLTEELDLTSDHEYRLTFDYGISNVSASTSVFFLVDLVYYNSNGEEIDSLNLYSSLIENTNVQSLDFSFKPNTSNISSGYACKLRFSFQRQYHTTELGYTHYFISEEIGFVDKDDDSGWFQKIINAIKEIPDKVANLGDRISNFFSDLKNGITDLGDKIGGFFIELKDNIVEGLKGLFVPSEGFFEEKKVELELFLEDHFGILWTAPNIIISTIEQLITMSPEEPSITMPAIQFTWENELITLTEPMTVNFNDYIGDGSPLEVFYNFYRAFVTIILIFLFINYCLKKYHYIFGKDGEAVEH